MDDKGKARIALDTNPTGEPRLGLFDANDKVRISLEVPVGLPTHSLFDKKGYQRVALWVSSDGATLILADKDGKVIWIAPPK